MSKPSISQDLIIEFGLIPAYVFTILKQEKNKEVLLNRVKSDIICQTANITAHQLLEALSSLETKGKIKQEHISQHLYIHIQKPKYDDDFWQSAIARLKQQGVPEDFIQDQLTPYKIFCHDKTSTGNEQGFIRWTMRAWRDYEMLYRADINKQPILEKTAQPIDKNWQPNQETIDMILVADKLSLETIKQHVAPFVLYWLDRDIKHHSWNSLFFKYMQDKSETPKDLPDVRSAYIEAAKSNPPRSEFPWSHPLIYEAGRSAGWAFLASSVEQKGFPVFRKHYEKLIKERYG